MATNNGNSSNGVPRRNLLRLVNDRIFDISRQLDRFDVLCECGKSDCYAQVEVTRSHYLSIRDDGSTLLVAPGHERESANAF
jgi:hypothetical protein